MSGGGVPTFLRNGYAEGVHNTIEQCQKRLGHTNDLQYGFQLCRDRDRHGYASYMFHDTFLHGRKSALLLTVKNVFMVYL